MTYLGAKHTLLARRRPVKLVWAAQFDRIGDAFRFEKQLQGWRRSKRRALIEGRITWSPTSCAWTE